MSSPNDILTIRETAQLLKLSDQHVRRLAEGGKLPGRKYGDRWRFSRLALLRFLDPSELSTAPEDVAVEQDDKADATETQSQA